MFSIRVKAQQIPHSVCFYYNWYGSNAIDGDNYHWKHPVMPENDKDTTKKIFLGNGDIGANFYPLTLLHLFLYKQEGLLNKKICSKVSNFVAVKTLKIALA